jgi:hypothetical protein
MMKSLSVSIFVVFAVVMAFGAIPGATSSVAIDGLKLVGEASGATLAEGTCPVKAQHTSCQQSVNTGAFGTAPAPQLLAEGTCPVKAQHTSCQQSVNTGAFGTCPAPRVDSL